MREGEIGEREWWREKSSEGGREGMVEGERERGRERRGRGEGLRNS